MCVFELGTWGLAPGADTVNMAVVIHEQPALSLPSRESRGNRPAKSHVTGERRGEERKKVADYGKMPWIPPLLQELPCRGLMPSSKEAAAMSLRLWGNLQI